MGLLLFEIERFVENIDMKTEYMMAAAAIAVVVILIFVIFRLLKRKPHPLPFDEMEGHDFEYFCAELLQKHGFLDVQVTKGSGDYGIDILAEKDDQEDAEKSVQNLHMTVLNRKESLWEKRLL